MNTSPPRSPHIFVGIQHLFCLAGCVGATIGMVAFFMIYGEAATDPKGYADRRMQEWAREFDREQTRMLEEKPDGR